MMSFLQNVLQRHQLGPASSPVSYIVQPRPQSRFESDQSGFIRARENRSDALFATATAETEPGLPPAQRAAKTEPSRATDNTTPPLSPAATQAATINGDMESGPGRSERGEGRIDAGPPSIDQTPFEHKPAEQQPVQKEAYGDPSAEHAIAASAIVSQGFRRAPQPTEPGTQQNRQQQAEIDNELNQRIETVLQAVNRLQTHTASHQTPLEPRQHITRANAAQERTEVDDFNQPVQAVLLSSDKQPVHADAQQAPVNVGADQVLPNTGDQTHTGLPGLAPVPEPTSPATEPPQQREQPGSLQIPDWLAGIQTQLNNRWRDINRQVEPEPAVNITIGRVEVRAVQDKPGKQAKARNRPSGVMTLDAYLKQRERGGQT